LKLDLHTHCKEATACVNLTLDIAKKIVAAVKDRGLDGIAVTDHYGRAFGYEMKEMVDHHLNGEITIIPGQEIDKLVPTIDRGFLHVHIVELYLPGDLTFRFMAHPDHRDIHKFDPVTYDSIHGIELKNPNYRYEMDEAKIREVAEEHDLLLLTNSDAHFLSDVGTYYNEIEIEELCARARSK
jgi:histidinol phosphatase-like PHP family hydrolase